MESPRSARYAGFLYTSPVFPRMIRRLPVLTCALAFTAMLFHNVSVHPQPDLQLIRYALEFLQSLQKGTLFAYWQTTHVYPFAPVFLVSIFVTTGIASLFLSGHVTSLAAVPAYVSVHPGALYLSTRLLFLATTVGTLLLTYRVARMLHPDKDPFWAVTLLLSSVLFLVFATAIRPHMLVTFWTTLAAERSLAFSQNSNRWAIYTAWAAAACAFATLPTGVFALAFPAVAVACDVHGRMHPRASLHFRALIPAACAVLLPVLFSYTYLLPNLLHGGAWNFNAIGQKEFAVPTVDGSGFAVLFSVLLGDSPIVTLAAMFGIAAAWRKHRFFTLSFLLYAVPFMVLFGLAGNVKMRFFLPLLPLFAIAGGITIARIPKIAQYALLACVMLLHLRLTYLFLQPDTYQETARILAATSGTVATVLPPYFLDIPPTRASIGTPEGHREEYFLSLPQDLPGARSFLAEKDWPQADVLVTRGNPEAESAPHWSVCGKTGQPDGRSGGLLWDDGGTWPVDPPLWTLWAIPRLGPGVTVLCKQKG